MRFVVLLPFIFASLAGCSWFQREEEVETRERSVSVVGEVTSVHPEEGFVLFRRYGPGKLLADGLLSSRSLDGKRAADLRLSPEKMGRFHTADYSKKFAAPREGDIVVLSKSANDTNIETLSSKESEDESAEVKKVISSPEPESLESTASQRSR